MKILFLSIVLCASLSFAIDIPEVRDVNGFAAEKRDIQVIESVGEAILGDDTTPAQAKAMALNNARRSAIEEASGVVIHGSTVVYNYQLISDLVKASTRGLIVKEEILIDDIKKEGKQIVYGTKIRVHVKPLEYQRDGSLKILKAEVNRYGSTSKGSVFQNGDEIQIKVKANKEGYINVFGISQDGMVTKLYPNEYFKAEVISPEMEFIFPDERQRGLGLKLKVRTPKNLSRTVETILIVATKERMDFLSDKKADEITITDLMKELSEIDSSSWTEEAIGYEISR
ncbi:MAG: hypothetical protein A3D97_04280 [Nitrospinae bacterium RIFCSPHIGHO2_12_FULL_39_42]|nr:MAG: hypothetical protein A3D97_04280 [Nitrospinae bacterium RIFCSPHIGHO2_12_FULL_39_42]